MRFVEKKKKKNKIKLFLEAVKFLCRRELVLPKTGTKAQKDARTDTNQVCETYILIIKTDSIQQKYEAALKNEKYRRIVKLVSAEDEKSAGR